MLHQQVNVFFRIDIDFPIGASSSIIVASRQPTRRIIYWNPYCASGSANMLQEKRNKISFHSMKKKYSFLALKAHSHWAKVEAKAAISFDV